MGIPRLGTLQTIASSKKTQHFKCMPVTENLVQFMIIHLVQLRERAAWILGTQIVLDIFSKGELLGSKLLLSGQWPLPISQSITVKHNINISM